MKKFAFVVMPFASPFNSVYRSLIKPAVEICEIDCIRADEESQGHIHSQMLQRIFESTVVIADITGLNANVFYELGVAHTTGYKTIVICEFNSLDKIPFDIAPYRVLAYQDPEKLQQKALNENIQRLAGEIRMVLNDPLAGIPNPVQDYLGSQSPVYSTNSLFINQLDALSEEQLLKIAKNELVYFGITANSFSDMITGIIETQEPNELLSVHLCLLDPKSHDCWEFLNHMSAGNSIDPTQLEQNKEEDILTQKRAVRKLESLAEATNNFSVFVHYYSFYPMFWAYMVDQQRLVIGHLALQRSSARHLPVNILVRDDLATQNLFKYYHSLIDSVARSGK